ncbi:glycosyltransferase family 4 protein [Candidatus Gottesmanbacteria bacterium]|nr:glycosyltransferase family 4 protein [Candidatus Gottesmanbacteria bacterium]
MKNEKEIKNLKIGIYSPYLNIFGGGERYILSIARAFSQDSEVYLYADKDLSKRSLEIFGINLKNTHLLPSDLLLQQNFLKKYAYLHKYDLFFYMSDGSLFFSSAKKNFLIVQSPLHIPNKNFLNRMKLANWKIICYSQFMRNIIRQKLNCGIKSLTLAPCIDVPNKKEKVTKDNIILSVGRFFPYPHDKKHEILVDLFKKSYSKYFSGWKLIIAGGLTEKGGDDIFRRLKDKSIGYPIEIMSNLSSDRLLEFYQKSKIYWHAAGFGEDLTTNPEKAEHFGIAPLEAMANGVVPIVFNGGGLMDIIDGENGGYLWNTLEELTQKTVNLIVDEKLLTHQEKLVRAEANKYSCDQFYGKLEKIIIE